MGTPRGLVARHLLVPPSPMGLALGSAAFLAALTPSLIPRAGVVQGAVAGLAFVTAYGIGAGTGVLWNWLGLPKLPAPLMRLGRAGIFIVSALLVVLGLSMARGWQNSVHAALGLPSVETVRPIVIAAVSLAVILALVGLGRIFQLLWSIYALPMERVLPVRVSLLLAFSLAVWSFWALGNGLFLDAVLRTLDTAYREMDLLRGTEEPAPQDPRTTGGPGSLVSWEGLGAAGRAYIASGPSESEIAALAGDTASRPLRVYVGLNSAATVEARTELALAELIRIGAFERKLLVIATPTGTGWVDPAAMMPLEILHRGDVATVAVQYSYLPSWLSLLVEPEYGRDTARAVFGAVYSHWHSLPRQSRPRLFLFGLSLGALNSDLASNAFDIIGDPYDGVFWAGPPFASRTWKEVTTSRLAGSRPWLPEAANPKLFRFMANNASTQLTTPGWGPLRILFLQYPSDPIVFFESGSWRRRPDWLDGPRPPDISRGLVWIPGVTFIQLVFDMMTAVTVPKGVGHVYAASHYLAGWQALTEPKGWTNDRLAYLADWLDSKGL